MIDNVVVTEKEKEPEVDRPKGNVVPGKALYDQRYADRNAGRGSKQSISE